MLAEASKLEVSASMIRTPAEAVPQELPPVAPDEELLDVAGVRAFVGGVKPVSIWWIDKYSKRPEDPLPWIGTKRLRRMRKSALIAWMERNASGDE